MRVPVHLVPGIAALLRYPGEGTAALAAALADAAMESAHPCQEHLEAFALVCRTSTLKELQEAYARVFDLNPDCTLEIGWHLFGETYKRGQFLAMVRFHLREQGIDPGSNLPDHLPALLELTMKLESQDAQDLVDDCILPALEKILPALKDSPYRHVLEALFVLFTAHRLVDAGAGLGQAPAWGAPGGTQRAEGPGGPPRTASTEVSHAG